MNGLSRKGIATAAAAAMLAAFTVTACGRDGDEPVPGIEPGPTGQTGGSGDGSGTTGSGSPGNGTSGNGPDSAGDRDPDAPDNSISDRPGGPGQSNGAQQEDGGNADASRGITPPPPSPAAP